MPYLNPTLESCEGQWLSHWFWDLCLNLLLSLRYWFYLGRANPENTEEYPPCDLVFKWGSSSVERSLSCWGRQAGVCNVWKSKVCPSQWNETLTKVNQKCLQLFTISFSNDWFVPTFKKMNVFYFWELFCQYLMPVNMSEVVLNRLLTPDPVHTSWFLLNWMCLTNTKY